MRYTLLSDGSSDRALIRPIDWLLRQHVPVDRIFQPEWADLRLLPKSPRRLADRIALAVQLYPCDILFIHRDAEGRAREKRLSEIRNAQEEAGVSVSIVSVVPVRMSEAWFLFDEQAIRTAAGNPGGRMPLNLPSVGELEQVADPKERLYDLLRKASGLEGRRRKRFSTASSLTRVAGLIDDFSRLRELPAFRALEGSVEAVVGPLYVPSMNCNENKE